MTHNPTHTCVYRHSHITFNINSCSCWCVYLSFIRFYPCGPFIWFLQVQFFPIEATRIICFASKNTHPPTVASSSHEILRSLWKPRSLHGANQHSTIGNYSLIEVNQEKINFIDWEANGLRSWAEFPLLFVQHMFSAKIMGLPTQCMHQFISYAVSDRHYQSTGILRRVHVQGHQKRGVGGGGINLINPLHV